MRTIPLLLAFSMLQVVVVGGVQAEPVDAVSAQILDDTLRVNKQALVEVNLGLTDAEAAAFWPVYERYQAELEGVQQRLDGVIDSYRSTFGSTTDEQASKLVSDYLDVERDRVAIRQKYLEPISEVLPGRKVMRFYQIENKIDAVLRYDLAATIPVVEQ